MISDFKPVIIPKNMQQNLKTIMRAMRVHQWVKNTLLFVPLILSHNLFNQDMLLATLVAFLAFSLCASAIYIINDIVDIESDRQHPTKKNRPFASGQLSIQRGRIMAAVAFLLALCIAFSINLQFVYILLVYMLITSSYSFYVKRVALLDVLLLAGLYTFRLIAGSVASGVAVSFWLLVFSVFIFLSLALVKRYSELYNLQGVDEIKATGRGYHISDMPLLLNIGIVSGYLSVLVMGFYMNDDLVMTHYSTPQWLWLVVASVLFWISRVWLLTFRGNMNEDPVMFAIHDIPSLAVLFICALAIVMAL